jgi:hypothetical protein
VKKPMAIEATTSNGTRVTYLTSLPTSIPSGQYLVHNNVRPTRRLGSRGFRAWLIAPSDHLTPCACGWAKELGPHYRL